MAAESWRNVFWLSKTFSGNFGGAVYPSRVVCLKDFGGRQKRDVTISGGTVQNFCKLWY